MRSILSYRNWLLVFSVFLIILSFCLFTVHYIVFHDIHHIMIYTIHDLAFLPIEVLLVTLIIHQLLERQAMKAKLEKMNMVIGLFFSEIGTPLLHYFVNHDPKKSEKTKFFADITTWDLKIFDKYKKEALKFRYSTAVTGEDLPEVRDILVSREEFLVRLLENPILFEHESFTELLRAAFHLTEELLCRADYKGLPGSDIKHLSEDIIRVYSALTQSWLSYLKYLKGNYPYLYSLAIRTNPFLEKNDVIIRE
jgi:hypothetical protein